MSKDLAEHFYTQCVGFHETTYGAIKNTPVIASIFDAAGMSDGRYEAGFNERRNFVAILRNFAKQLEESL